MSKDVREKVSQYENCLEHKYNEMDSPRHSGPDRCETVTEKAGRNSVNSTCCDLLEPSLSAVNKGTSSVEEREKPVVINGVKVQPGCMIFKDAYDGKRYKQKVTITNCRKVNVNVRICPPSSKAFQIKPMPIGHTLSPGLSIVRYIKYLYAQQFALPQACMDIMIDNDCLRYELLVQTCYTQVSVSPKVLDFGEIDIGLVSKVKKITVTNTGTKLAQFATDLGCNQLELMVEPTRGSVQPGESKEISVEVFGSNEGYFSQEFWIKTDPLQRVHIQGCFIAPCLNVAYPLADNNLLILNFRKTFAGVPQQRNVVFLNHSSTSAVFCVNARTENEKLPYMKAVEKDINFKQFQVVPLEGRLHRDQKFVLRVMFIPQNPVNRPNYYICSAIVDVRTCRSDGNPCEVQKSHNSDIPNAQPNFSLQDSISVISLNETPHEPPQEIAVLDDMVTILLYGEVELPDISISPDKIYLKNLKVYETHLETLTIVNNSETLPVTLKYLKIPSIVFEPATIILPPRRPMEATLKVRPTQMGEVSAKLTLDVFYYHKSDLHKIATTSFLVVYCGEYNEERKLLRKKPHAFLPGIVPTNNNEVGYLVDDVRFNTQIEMPKVAIVDRHLLAFDKNNDALIAFPNDRPRILKPWRNTVPCKTIFTQLPRLVTPVDVDYDLTTRQKFLKNSTQTYYDQYIKSLNKNRIAKMPQGDSGDYDVTDQRKILMENIKNKELIACYFKSNIGNLKQSLFVPMTPYQIQNTVVTPKFIQLGRLAANTQCADYFNVENKNDFPIHICIKSLYTSITISEEEFILEGSSQKKIHFVYHSDPSGTHHIPMFIIMNFFHVLDVTVLASIVKNTVRCVTRDLFIKPSEKTAFLELRNPLNSDVAFQIETNFNILESFPSRGVIPPKRNMTITVTLNPEAGNMPVKEMAVVSESGAKELINVHIDPRKAPVALSSECLTFKNIPLNTKMTQELSIFNKSEQFVPLRVKVEKFEADLDLTISPMKAMIVAKGIIVLTFSIVLKEVAEFTVPVNLIFQFEYPQQILITGNVIYPDVSFRPALIKINKIPSGSILTAPFRVFNNSDTRNYLSFPMGNFTEFAIKTKTGKIFTDDNEMLYLAPREKRDLLLEFRPQEPVAYCLSLPYVINGMLGPPELNRPESLLRDSYFNLKKGASVSQQKNRQVEKLNVLKILCAASKKLLEFNSLQLEFSSFENPHRSFIVTNVSTVSQEVTLKITDIETFKFTLLSDHTFIQDEQIQATIEPKQTSIVCIEFTPIVYGEFQYNIPIFVKDYSETVPFNQLRIKGHNPTPKISTNTPVIYFTPTFPGSRQVISFFLDLIAHKCDKKVEVEFNCPTLEVTFVAKTNVSEALSKLAYKIAFAPTDDCSIETEIIFTCSCSTSSNVEVYACGDKALIINFMSAPDIVADSTYPFFPSPSDTSDYADIMRQAVPVIERWLFTQGYFYQNYYRIPDDMVSFGVEFSDSKKSALVGKKKPSNRYLPLVQLLINLIDNSILKFIHTSCEQLQQLHKRTSYNYSIYKRTIKYLQNQFIVVPGLKPEHLLSYEEYQEYKQTFTEESLKKNEEFTQETFYNFSKQKWLDLFCHIYKVLVQQRIVDPAPASVVYQDNEEFIKKDKEEFDEYVRVNIKRLSNLFMSDAKLLLWLEYHLNRQRRVLWPDKNFEGTQYMNDFCDVEDSVSLATVTAAYCPYLRDHLKDVYPKPKNIEQKIHNSCKVVQAWKNLKLSFDVHPQTIVIANRVKIIFIVTYLYDVLPNFYPTNEVTIEAPLSESVSYHLNVQNCGHVQIHYNAIFFGQNSEVFKLDAITMSIPGGKSRKLELTYTAKKVLDASAILVLSGEAGGQRYAKSMVVQITGVPKSTSSVEIKLQVETYKLTKRKLTFKSPYGSKNYRAKIFICCEEPKSYKDLHSVASMRGNYIPREIDIATNECEFNDKGETTVTLTTCFLSQASMNFYLYLCNDTVGDFCVLIKVTPVLPKTRAIDIPVELHPHFNKPCSCLKGFNVNCPKAFTVYIPSRNDHLWSATSTMLKRCFSESSYKLVRKFFGTPLIFRLLKFYLERFPIGFMIPSCIFDDSTTLFVTQASARNFSMLRPTVRINDVTSSQAVPLVLHWQDSERPVSYILELKGENLKEIRLYRLIFTEEVISVHDISSTKLSQFSSSLDK